MSTRIVTKNRFFCIYFCLINVLYDYYCVTKPTYPIPELPLPHRFEGPEVLLALNRASRALAELKGITRTIPNEEVLISTLTLREARDSSAVENIITTQDELFRADIGYTANLSSGAKEVHRYAAALRKGFLAVRNTGIITQPYVLNIQRELEQNAAGIRRTPGTSLRNQATGEVVYVTPQHSDEINKKLDNLLTFINDPDISALDPLIKMAIIHHQFESIHPFYDGNGRTGRIINILYLVQQGLLDLPILYLSQYIIKNKAEYYRLLQAVRDKDDWDAWVIYLLDGVAATAKNSIDRIINIRQSMQATKRYLRENHPKTYSQDLLNNIYRHPYTKINLVADDLRVHPNTVRSYLAILVEAGILREYKFGRGLYFINHQLISILAQ